MIAGAFTISSVLAGCSAEIESPDHAPVVLKSSFDTAQVTHHEPDSVEVRFGSSFGECTGYCRTEFALHSWGLECWQRGWATGGDTTLFPTRRQVIEVPDALYEQIMRAVDTTSLWSKSKNVRFGCPDCADGGSCWVEVRKEGVVKYLNYDCIGGAGVHEAFVELVRGPAHHVTWWEPGDLYVPPVRTDD